MTPYLFAPGSTQGDLREVDDLTAVVELVEACSPAYLRYSEGPLDDERTGPSRDYEADVELPGLSVTTVEPEAWWPRATIDWVARRLLKYAELGAERDRHPWLLTGEVAGYGPDHEPLIVNARPIARIGPNALRQAESVYRERFRVGQDSSR